MHDISITGPTLSLFESYLEHREQIVKTNDFISSEQTIKCGVPQGTILSPVLFNIQLNDIKLLKLNSNIICRQRIICIYISAYAIPYNCFFFTRYAYSIDS